MHARYPPPTSNMARRFTLDKVVEETGVSWESLKRECSQDDLLGLAEYCDSLTVVGLRLGLSETQIGDIEGDNKTREEKRVGLMLKWKTSSGFKATYMTFVEALLACGRPHAATEICTQLAKENEVEPTSSSIVAEQQSEQLHDTLPPSGTEGQGLLRIDSFIKEPTSQNGENSEPDEAHIPQLEISNPASDIGLSEQQTSEESTDSEEEQTSLQSKIVHFDRQYQLIGEKLTEALEQSAVTLSNLQRYAATLSMSVKRCYEELQKKNELPTQTKHATCMSEFVGVLYDYSNFLNPALLEDVVRRFGDEESKSLMKRYNDKLDEFQRATTLEQFVNECMYKEDLPEGYVEIELVMKSDWQKKTLNDIKPPKRSWLLNKVYYGSLRVVFSIPDLSDLEEVEVIDFLQHNVRRVLVSGQCILDLEPEEATSGLFSLEDQIQLEESSTTFSPLPSFRFSSVTDNNVILSDNGLEARTKDIDTHFAGGVYVDTPLSGRSEIELEIVSVRRDLKFSVSASIIIGIGQCRKGTYSHLDIPFTISDSFPTGVCFWSGCTFSNRLHGVNDANYKYGSVSLDDLQEGDTVTMEVSETGDLSFYVNGDNQGIAARRLYNEEYDNYFVVNNITGRYTALRITRAAISADVHPSAKDPRHALEKTSTCISANTIKFGFQSVTGPNILLLEDGLYARRKYPKYSLGSSAIYGSHPLNRRGTFEVAIAEEDIGRFTGTVSVGVRLLPTTTELEQSIKPTNIGDGANHIAWVGREVRNRLGPRLIRNEYASLNQLLRKGVTVGMRVTYDGSLSFFINGESKGVAARGLHEYAGYDIYPAIDVLSECRAVRITRAKSDPEVLGLQELCIEKIASCLDWSSKNVNLLPLPLTQKNRIEHFIDYL